jgi:hypothetical protein
MSRRTLPRRKVRRRQKCGRRSKRRLPRPNLTKKRSRSVVAERWATAGPGYASRVPKQRAPTIAEALFMAQRLLDSDGDGRSKLDAYFGYLFDHHPMVFSRLLIRAMDEEAAEDRGAANVDG